jgi:SPP1 gp7 family putative phage head morphogenesis protein
MAKQQQPKPKKLKRPKRPPPPINIEKEYKKDLTLYVSAVRTGVEKYLLPHLNDLMQQMPNYKRHDSSVTSMLDQIMSQINAYVINNTPNPKSLAIVIGNEAYNFATKNFKAQIKDVLGVDAMLSTAGIQEQLDLWVSTNVSLINSIPNHALSQIEALVKQGLASGERVEELSADIMERVDVSQSRANLIARDQVSKLNGQIDQLNQTNAGVDKYIWSTSMDERVRESHADKQGETFSWDDPPADTGHPGEDYQCRCVALPIFTEQALNQ